MAAQDLTQLSIEDLANIQVSSVSKVAEPLSDAPAAIYVITRDDIVRSGATSIPEMLRLAPNLEVAQINATSYAISARGFNGQIADKLLVLIDGRSVYTPIFAGVYWDMQYVPVEDIDRIEVISGPGGTLWGANAVNGVINIITRKSSDTQGGVADLGGGNVDREGNLQYGGRVNDALTYRLYGDRFLMTDSVADTGTDARDGWRKSQGGFRLDWAPSNDLVTVQGDIYYGDEKLLGANDQFISGDNMLARWNHAFEGGSNLQVQAYYDEAHRYFLNGIGGDQLDTYDLDLQHSFSLNSWNAIVWGGGERLQSYQVYNTPGLQFIPNTGSLHFANLFVEDTISITDGIKLIPGVKLEDDAYVGLTPVPSLRASWKVTDTNLIWASISRAIRSPTPFDRDAFAGGGLLIGGPDFQSEKVTAYEIGYRTQPIPDASLSISTFYNDYKQLRSIAFSPLVVPFQYANFTEGDTYGVEVWGNYKVNDWWRLSAGFNVQHENLAYNIPLGPGAIGAFEATLVPSLIAQIIQFTGNDPTHQASLRSSMNLPHGLTFDAELREVGALPNPAVSSYVELNSRLGWNVTQSAQLSLAGYNLLHPQHLEFGATPGATEVPRSFFVNLQVRF